MIFCTILIAVILTVNQVAECAIFTPQEEMDITSYIESVMECRKTPGLTLAVVKGSETWTKGFGIADLKTGRKVNEETLFGIGSLAKAFTSTLLGDVLDETGYQWDSKLADIEEVSYDFATEELTKNATLADLLTHKTGLSTSLDYAFIGGYPPGITRELLGSRINNVPKVLGFRSSFSYNNMMYVLAGHVSEVLAKDTYENMMSHRVFEPLGMVSSMVGSSRSIVTTGNVAKPIICKEVDGEFEEGNYDIYDVSPLEPAGSIMSNAADMAKWMRFNLNNGTTQNGKPMFNKDSFLQIFESQTSIYYYSLALDLKTPTFPVNDLNTAYGFGWFVSTYRGHRRYWHSGGFFSYVSYLWMFPDENVGIFVNVNGPGNNHKPGDAIKTIMYFISDILLQEEPWMTQHTACTFPSPWRNASIYSPSNPIPTPQPLSPVLSDYIGRYGNKVFPDINIVEDNDILKFEMNRIKGVLHPTDQLDEFKLELTDPWEYAIEKVVNENLTITMSLKFKRNQANETIKFDWLIDTWITFQKGVYIVDDEEDPIALSCNVTQSMIVMLGSIFIAILTRIVI